MIDDYRIYMDLCPVYGGVAQAYTPAADRYERMTYRRSGRNGLRLPAISLGLWHNFGHDDRPLGVGRRSSVAPSTSRSPLRSRQQLRAAVRLRGGELRADPPGRPGTRPRRAGDLDESRLRHVAGAVRRMGLAQVPAASLDQGLRRMGLDYVDIFYSHRFDPETPLEETMGALDTAVRQGRRSTSASRPTRRRKRRGLRDPARARRAVRHPPALLLDAEPLDRGRAPGHAWELGIGCIVFSPLAQGMLTDKYLDGIPEGSRATRDSYSRPSLITDECSRRSAR